MSDGDGVDVVELAVVDVAGGQLGVVQRQEAHEQGVVGLAESSDVAQRAERLGDRSPAATTTPVPRRLHLHCPDLPTDIVVGFASLSATVVLDGQGAS